MESVTTYTWQDVCAERSRRQKAVRIHKKEEIHNLEQQVAALQEKLGQARLQSVQEKAELETLNRFAVARKAQLNASDLAGDVQAGRFGLDEPAASALAVLLTEIQGPSKVPISAAECRSVTVALMADAYEDWRRRIGWLLDIGADEPGSPAAEQLEWHIEQFRNVWCIGEQSIVWKRTPSLYLAMHGEVVRRTVARHGPAPNDDCRRKEDALRLSPEQHGVLLAAAEAMAGRLQGIAAQQQAVLARVKTLNRGTMPMTTAGIHPDLMPEVYALVRQQKDAITAFIECFWNELRPAQLARALLATPYFLCGLELGQHIISSASWAGKAGKNGTADCANTMAGVFAWLQGDGALAALPGDTDGKAPPEVRQAIDTLGANVTNGKPRQAANGCH